MMLFLCIVIGVLAGLACYWIQGQVDKTNAYHMCIFLFIGGLYGFVIWHIRDDFSQAVLLVVSSALLYMGATIDKHYWILPDWGASLLALCGLLYRYLLNQLDWLCFVVSGLTLGVMYLLYVLSRHNFGLGDVKWMAALSLWMTPWEVYSFITLSFVCGCLYLAVCNRTWSTHTIRNRYIPFGPPMACAAFLVLHGHWLV